MENSLTPPCVCVCDVFYSKNTKPLSFVLVWWISRFHSRWLSITLVQWHRKMVSLRSNRLVHVENCKNIRCWGVQCFWRQRTADRYSKIAQAFSARIHRSTCRVFHSLSHHRNRSSLWISLQIEFNILHDRCKCFPIKHAQAAASVKEHDRDEALCRLNETINAINDKTSLVSPALTVQARDCCWASIMSSSRAVSIIYKRVESNYSNLFQSSIIDNYVYRLDEGCLFHLLESWLSACLETKRNQIRLVLVMTLQNASWSPFISTNPNLIIYAPLLWMNFGTKRNMISSKLLT